MRVARQKQDKGRGGDVGERLRAELENVVRRIAGGKKQAPKCHAWKKDCGEAKRTRNRESNVNLELKFWVGNEDRDTREKREVLAGDGIIGATEKPKLQKTHVYPVQEAE